MLEADSNTDWSQVDLETLRQHLVDMELMTKSVEIVAQEPVPEGLAVTVRGTTSQAHDALARVFEAHPPQLQAEAGWTMTVSTEGELYHLTITTPNPDEVVKVRGLGYIGVMALGEHHQPHHYMLATGQDPHTH